MGDALQISGDIVLRAAKRGVSAGELIGLVLSQALVAEELAGGGSVAWFLLDDYAVWLGQKEQGIADILALCIAPNQQGGFQLRVVVTEAKYVGADQCADARRGSKQQLRQTVVRIEDALFGDGGRTATEWPSIGDSAGRAVSRLCGCRGTHARRCGRCRT